MSAFVPTIAIAQQPPNPQGGSPHGGGKPRAQGQYEPPEDIVTPSEEIPAGTIVVRILDAEDKPVANTDVTLQILHQSVALGDTKESKQGTTNDDGFVQFDGLKVGTRRREGARHDLVGSAIGPQGIDRDTDRHGAEPR